jgi:hypothetical protein
MRELGCIGELANQRIPRKGLILVDRQSVGAAEFICRAVEIDLKVLR